MKTHKVLGDCDRGRGGGRCASSAWACQQVFNSFHLSIFLFDLSQFFLLLLNLSNFSISCSTDFHKWQGGREKLIWTIMLFPHLIGEASEK